MKHYYPDVPGLGNVALSRHAQDRAEEDHITDVHVEEVFLHGRDTHDADSVWREHNGIRMIIITPTPFRGAKLVKTMYRVQRAAH